MGIRCGSGESGVARQDPSTSQGFMTIAFLTIESCHLLRLPANETYLRTTNVKEGIKDTPKFQVLKITAHPVAPGRSTRKNLDWDTTLCWSLLQPSLQVHAHWPPTTCTCAQTHTHILHSRQPGPTTLFVTPIKSQKRHCNPLQHIATHCNTL